MNGMNMMNDAKINIKNAIVKVLGEMARSNPDLNPKVTVAEELKPYANDPDIYISFTVIDKIGINPSSGYHTPNGIYTYPLKEIYHHIQRDTVPFAGDSPYVWILRNNNSGKFINDMHSQYTSKNYDDDIKELNRNYNDIFPIKYLDDEYDKYVTFKTFADLKKYAIDTTQGTSIISKFWNITRILADAIRDEGKKRPDLKTFKTQATAWNYILRQLGYSGFADKSGKGIIHESEPTQAVFLYKSAFDIIDKIHNIKGLTATKAYYIALDHINKFKEVPEEVQNALGTNEVKKLLSTMFYQPLFTTKFILDFINTHNINFLDYFDSLHNTAIKQAEIDKLIEVLEIFDPDRAQYIKDQGNRPNEFISGDDAVFKALGL